MGKLLSAKIWLTMGSWGVAVLVTVAANLNLQQTTMLALLLLAGTLMSYSDFLMTCFRAVGRYSNETKVTVKGNLAYLALALGALYSFEGAIAVTAAFAIGRLIHLLFTIQEFKRQLPAPMVLSLDVRTAWATIKAGTAYGMDVAVAIAFVNIDVLFVTHLLGYESAGTYQAAARFYQGAALLPPLFAGLFLPRLAKLTDDVSNFTLQANKLYWAMLICGLALCGIFMAGTQAITWIYPDPSLASVGVLLPWLGLLVLVRFTAAAEGIVLTALGGQRTRAMLFLVALLIMAATAYPLMYAFGTLGIVLAGCCAYSFLAVAFWAWIELQGVRNRRSLGIACFATILVAVTLLTLNL
jgi:O-antigen/teichoic acid export membrane protein